MNAPVDIGDAILETERLVLRPWRETDLADFNEYASVDGVGQMAGWKPHESLEESQRILTGFIDHKKTFALELKENGKVIGSIGLEEENRHEGDIQGREGNPPKGQGREIGYVLSKDYWGQGLMSEAVKRVISYCFEEAGCDYLFCGHFLENDQSRRVIEKCGFTFYGTCEFKTVMGDLKTGRLYLLIK